MSGRTAIVTLLAAVCLVALSTTAPAATYLVRSNGSGDYATIQDAIDAVVDTDIIELASGTFDDDGNRDLDYLGKAITIRSQSGDPADVTIDCEGGEFDPHRAFWFHNGEGSSSVLQNITILGGYIVDGNGGAILCEGGAAPTIEGCVFGSNIVLGSGASGAARTHGQPGLLRHDRLQVHRQHRGRTHGRAWRSGLRGRAPAGRIRRLHLRTRELRGWPGGGVYVESVAEDDLLLTDCIVTDNGAAQRRGVLLQIEVLLALDGCSVYWNEATTVPAWVVGST